MYEILILSALKYKVRVCLLFTLIGIVLMKGELDLTVIVSMIVLCKKMQVSVVCIVNHTCNPQTFLGSILCK